MGGLKYLDKMKKNLEELTLKEVIETLVTYNIEHTRFPHNYLLDLYEEMPFIYGLSMDDRKLILINQELSDEEKRETIIHELIHTKHYRLGDLKSRECEKIVQLETIKTYKSLYGIKPEK